MLALPNWKNSFFRESYVLSPGYINPYNKEAIAPDSAPIMIMLICTPECGYSCIELFFEEVEEIYLSFKKKLKPIASYRNDRILFSFHGNESSNIQSKFLYYRILENNSWGLKIRYGKKNIFDSRDFLISENL